MPHLLSRTKGSGCVERTPESAIHASGEFHFEEMRGEKYCPRLWQSLEFLDF
jgi:hypothetical protein